MIELTAPVGGPACGKVVYSDMHVGYSSLSSRGIPYPKQCSTQGLMPQAKAFAFLLYNTTICDPDLE